MRLYLSSYRIGDRAGSLLALLGNGRRTAIVENALDHIPEAARQLYRREGYDPAAELASLGLMSTLLDLRDYFGNPEGLRTTLSGFDLVWVLGGNAFVLRRAMKQSGFDDVITDMLDNDEIVYGGFSAGAVVTAPSLEGIHLMDDPDEVPAGYDPEVVWDGLGLIDHAIVPHYRSPHPECAAAERAVRHLCSRGLRYRALRDGEVIVWTEDRQSSVDPTRRIA
ncbi:Type 1 glutamine amidotransferase-like domain-containing protein [Devosia sp. ZB163]|uniref:Type 1 glutamine amidotransferase-like domain-containing protein n=1 Tax=Devosia sp. ZB163 TaxID=3025938 RepID=UPI00235DC415|nr:Type 1 glutamine amidotransferase-like domain-containing protein [Devosia sp. ZB163]MDC9822104.1 Type 1 glutamine amidotransferase-like domain-containing protein [Devosia sp. ZB163]